MSSSGAAFSTLQTSAAASSDKPKVPLKVDTTAGSLTHWLAGYYLRGEVSRPPSGFKGYTVAIALTYLPLMIAGMVGPLPLLARSQSLRLPFLLDWNVAFMFLVSLPTLAALIITDQHMLSSALSQVQMDGILLLPADTAVSLSSEWAEKFKRFNVLAEVIGVIVGITVAAVNYRVYSPPETGFWIASRGHLLPSGYIFLWSIFLCYTLVPIYVLRSFAMSLLLKDVVRNAQLHLLPFHPDRSGGLRPVGRLGIRNQYALTVFGVNVVVLAIITFHYLGPASPWLYGLIVSAAAAYVILGPFVFLGPLLPFRTGMLRTKALLMSEVAQRLRVELDRLREKLASADITKDDEELIDRLRKVGSVIDELPVWPFDAGTLRRFVSAYVLPLAGTLGYALLKGAFPHLIK